MLVILSLSLKSELSIHPCTMRKAAVNSSLRPFCQFICIAASQSPPVCPANGTCRLLQSAHFAPCICSARAHVPPAHAQVGRRRLRAASSAPRCPLYSTPSPRQLSSGAPPGTRRRHVRAFWLPAGGGSRGGAIHMCPTRCNNADRGSGGTMWRHVEPSDLSIHPSDTGGQKLTAERVLGPPPLHRAGVRERGEKRGLPVRVPVQEW